MLGVGWVLDGGGGGGGSTLMHSTEMPKDWQKKDW